MVQVTIIEEASSGCGVISALFMMLWTVLPTVAICCYLFREQIRLYLSEAFSGASKKLNSQTETKVETKAVVTAVNIARAAVGKLKDLNPVNACMSMPVNLEKERLEKERIEYERIEKEHLEKERLEKERLEKERIEKERIEKAEKKKINEEKLKKLDEEKDRLINEIRDC